MINWKIKTDIQEKAIKKIINQKDEELVKSGYSDKDLYPFMNMMRWAIEEYRRELNKLEEKRRVLER